MRRAPSRETTVRFAQEPVQERDGKDRADRPDGGSGEHAGRDDCHVVRRSLSLSVSHSQQPGERRRGGDDALTRSDGVAVPRRRGFAARTIHAAA